MRFLTVLLIGLVITAQVYAAEDAGNQKPEKASNKETQSEKTPDVNTIVRKANHMAYYQGRDGTARVHMDIISKDGQKREIEFVILRKDVEEVGDQKYYVYFFRPYDVREMVYLVHKHDEIKKDDDRWLYLPSLDLVKRIAAGDKRTSFVGSDYLYEDVSGRSLELDKHELVKTTDEYFVVKNTPKKPEDVEFGYYDVWIDRKNFIPMKMEYYDKNGKLYRIIETKKVEKIQDFPTPVKSIVKNLKTGSETIMVYTDVKYDIDIGDIFTERYLRRPPREVRR